MFCCVEFDFISLECSEGSVSEFRGIYRFSMKLGSLSFNVRSCVPILLEKYHGLLICTASCWLLDGAWFQSRYRDFWVSSCLLMLHGVRNSLFF